MQSKIEKLLLDIRKATEEIEDFTAGKSFSDFQKDRGLQLIIERELEIIGEALNRLLRIVPDLEKKIPETHRIIGLRNIITHGYDILEYEILWDIIENKVSQLQEKLKQEFEE